MLTKPRELYPIASLPLPRSARILTHNLSPDPAQPSPYTLWITLQTRPSSQRRSRLVRSPAHFSYLTPFPSPFPYRVPPPPESDSPPDGQYIENWLASQEAIEDQPLAGPRHPTSSSPSHSSIKLKKYSAPERNIPRELLAISPLCLQDCFPNLDVGDAFKHMGPARLVSSSNPQNLDLLEAQQGNTPEEEAVAAREELVDVLSGHSVLMYIPDDGGEDNIKNTDGYAPWSLRYSGHQFGNWAGQLGDGRAISILETPHPSDPSLTYEIQLKGAGRTPFSRFADGLAVLRSSVREFLGSEAIHALGIPTTRALSLISLPKLPVVREKLEAASVVSRVAPSFLRIGCFETFNPPETTFYLGGPVALPEPEQDMEGMRVLGEWVSQKVLNLDLGSTTDGAPESWGKKLVWEIARRNAKMVAGWQAYGFMHGVMNTDNISVLGLTIDYGPYAFMDVYNYGHICNHSDEEGRYAFRFQPTMIIYALRSLLRALSPLIGAEMELGHAVGPNWAGDASKEKLSDWSKEALKLAQDLEAEIQGVFQAEYHVLMRKRLALKKAEPADGKLIQGLLEILQNQELDFHSTFRTLTTFRPDIISGSDSSSDTHTDDRLEKFLGKLVPTSTSTLRTSRREEDAKEWIAWLERYAARIDGEKGEWDLGGANRHGNGDGDAWLHRRELAGKDANPRFVLRQWVLEEVIKLLEDDMPRGREVLLKILHMASDPFEPWGAEDDARPDDELEPETREERRFCGMGEQKMLGFQCSCSS
ncbi:hypothetical protein BOTBODRAFT_27846 [Botryobasidium botryosum FD-172 SS1]|uniref:Selenoprotein O n=1 Tax=Botryobasidium botryosum (strain FD-172 SS1) TaxID=930990 RepID=A0A067N664_BOTB1|nr:hypothetical protein BOTBODRAFT_27846 [Botryobasidium botryosum FD-172 SS1]